MTIVIIGAAGHGKNTLAKAMEQLSNIKCEVMNTHDLINYSKEQQKKVEEEKELLVINECLILESKKNNHHRKKGKDIKPWQRTKFYQK